MKKIKCLLKSKRGVSYPLTCVVVMVISMMLSVWMEYAMLMQDLSAQKAETRLKLEEVLTQYAIEHYEELKQGNESVPLDQAEIQAAVWETVGLDGNGERLDEDGYGMRDAELHFTEGGGWSLRFSYLLTLPVQWNGVRYTDLTLPVTVTGTYLMK